MIVNWKGKGIKVIPILAKQGGAIIDKLVLVPGHNFVDDALWKEARVHVSEKNVLDERIEEVKEEKDGKKVDIKDIGDLTPAKAEAIIKDTYNLNTLKTWAQNELRDSVRLALKNQIETIEKYGEDKAKKVKKDDEK